MPEPRYKTTLEIPFDLYVRFKEICQQLKMPMRDVVVKAIEDFVAKHEGSADKGKPAK